jgi:MraZ protein
MKLFLGEYSHTLDDRGRITLPRKIRQELETYEVVVSQGFDQCIFGYDKKQWEEEAAKQLSFSVTEEKARKLRRYMFAAAEKVEVDKLGRIVLPAHLKEYGKISGEVMVIGAGDHFEIWDTKAWEAYRNTL